MRAPEVKVLVDSLTVRVEQLAEALTALKEQQVETARKLEEYCRHQDKVIAVLEYKVEELRKGRDLWGGRTFTVVVAAVTAAVGAAVGYFLRRP